MLLRAQEVVFPGYHHGDEGSLSANALRVRYDDDAHTYAEEATHSMTTSYNADDITHLSYPQAQRRRVGMYLGARGKQQSTGAREITDNAVGEAQRGFASRILVTFGRDKSLTVQDDGRGLPTDVNAKSGKNGIILTMATMHAGANFATDVAKGKAGAGLNGVGGAVTNAVSKRFDVEVFKGGEIHRLSFQKGIAGHFAGEGPEAPFAPGETISVEKDTRTASEKALFKTGTRIKLWFDEDLFPSDEEMDVDDLIARLRYTAYIQPNLRIQVLDDTKVTEDGSPLEPQEHEFFSEHGLSELVSIEAVGEPLPFTDSKTDEFTKQGVYHLNAEGQYKEIVQNEDGKAQEITRTATAEVAWRYGMGYEKRLLSFANTIHTHVGGVHEKALEEALVKAFGDRMSTMRGILSAKDEAPIADDFFEGMDVVISVNVPEPQFRGQQKDFLSGPEVKRALTKALTEAFTGFVQAPENQSILKPMFEKVVTASKNRQAAAEAKAAKRKSTQVSSASLPSKLADCDITGEEESELLICEGDSAAGTIEKARDATYQAVLPIRGKMLNTLDVSLSKIMGNREIMDIAKALGAGFGKDFDIERIRYGKVLFAADADVDGLHINNLLYTLFYRVFPAMVEEGRVYQTIPPLFEVTVKGTKEPIYVANEAELNTLERRLTNDGKTYKVERNKGLGQMSPESFSDTVLDPEKRTLRRITIEDAQAAEAALMLTMGANSQERKDLMSDNFQVAIDTGLVEGFEGGID